MSRWSRVKPYRVCAICRHGDFCIYRELQGKTQWYCMRTESAERRETELGTAYVHYTEGGTGWAPEPETEDKRAHVQRRSAVYSAMLDRCDLSAEHLADLTGRGFSGEEVTDTLRYRTVSHVAKRLALDGYNLQYVPGFWRREDGWTMLDKPGFFVPVLDRRGRTQALQIRSRLGSKYVWFSSPPTIDDPRWDGAGSGVPVHRRPKGDGPTWVIEGPLKADYVWLRRGFPTIGTAGVGTAHKEICEALLEPTTTGVVLAYDGDWRSNANVCRSITSLAARIVRTANFMPEIAHWEGEGGVDDAMEAGLRIEMQPADEWFLEHEDLIYATSKDAALIDSFRETIVGSRRKLN